ncbi:hypothetical protein V8F33_009364 [Rhypophila sp. PSN 637]
MAMVCYGDDNDHVKSSSPMVLAMPKKCQKCHPPSLIELSVVPPPVVPRGFLPFLLAVDVIERFPMSPRLLELRGSSYIRSPFPPMGPAGYFLLERGSYSYMTTPSFYRYPSAPSPPSGMHSARIESSWESHPESTSVSRLRCGIHQFQFSTVRNAVPLSRCGGGFHRCWRAKHKTSGLELKINVRVSSPVLVLAQQRNTVKVIIRSRRVSVKPEIPLFTARVPRYSAYYPRNGNMNRSHPVLYWTYVSQQC